MIYTHPISKIYAARETAIGGETPWVGVPVAGFPSRYEAYDKKKKRVGSMVRVDASIHQAGASRPPPEIYIKGIQREATEEKKSGASITFHSKTN